MNKIELRSQIIRQLECLCLSEWTDNGERREYTDVDTKRATEIADEIIKDIEEKKPEKLVKCECGKLAKCPVCYDCFVKGLGNIKTPEFYNERFFMEDNLDLVDLIGEIQREAYLEGMTVKSEENKPVVKCCNEEIFVESETAICRRCGSKKWHREGDGWNCHECRNDYRRNIYLKKK